jgi:hypothetical protein
MGRSMRKGLPRRQWRIRWRRCQGSGVQGRDVGVVSCDGVAGGTGACCGRCADRPKLSTPSISLSEPSMAERTVGGHGKLPETATKLPTGGYEICPLTVEAEPLPRCSRLTPRVAASTRSSGMADLGWDIAGPTDLPCLVVAGHVRHLRECPLMPTEGPVTTRGGHRPSVPSARRGSALRCGTRGLPGARPGRAATRPTSSRCSLTTCRKPQLGIALTTTRSSSTKSRQPGPTGIVFARQARLTT